MSDTTVRIPLLRELVLVHVDANDESFDILLTRVPGIASDYHRHHSVFCREATECEHRPFLHRLNSFCQPLIIVIIVLCKLRMLNTGVAQERGNMLRSPL